MASGRSLRLMNELLAVVFGQVCQRRSSAFAVWPRPISDLATRTSMVSSCATGWAGGFVVDSAREIGGNATRAKRDDQDDNPGCIHTLYYLLMPEGWLAPFPRIRTKQQRY